MVGILSGFSCKRPGWHKNQEREKWGYGEDRIDKKWDWMKNHFEEIVHWEYSFYICIVYMT